MKIDFNTSQIPAAAYQYPMAVLDSRVADSIILNSVRNGIVARGKDWKLEKRSNFYLYHVTGKTTRQGYSISEFGLK